MVIIMEELLENDDYWFPESERLDSEIVEKCRGVNLFHKHCKNNYKVTINVQPERKMNNRQWKLYTHDKQREILARIMNAFIRDNATVGLFEMQFEECPGLKQIHLHALLSMTKVESDRFISYIDRTCGSTYKDSFKGTKWRHIDCQVIPDTTEDVKGWLKYIRKDLAK